MRRAACYYKRSHSKRLFLFYIMGIPLPLPIPPGGIMGWSPPPERGFLTVSSTERMRQAASEAAVSALIFTIDGSHTHSAKLSATSSDRMSTPYQVPF